MKTINVGRNKLEIYDSIEELPIRRFHKFNKYLLVDAGIGSDLNDLNDHIFKLAHYIDIGDKANANKLLSNFRQSLFLIAEENNVKHLSFMVLIKSINGKEVHDLSDENLKKMLSFFAIEPKSFLDKLFEMVKKKLNDELKLYFPNNFDDASLKEYYQKLKSRVMLQLQAITQQKSNDEEIGKIDAFLISLAKPLTFSGKDSAEIKFEKQFEEMCLHLKKEIAVEPSEMTVLQFYNAFEFIKKQSKKNGNGKPH